MWVVNVHHVAKVIVVCLFCMYLVHLCESIVCGHIEHVQLFQGWIKGQSAPLVNSNVISKLVMLHVRPQASLNHAHSHLCFNDG